MWMDIIANELVSVLTTLGIILRINKDVMGLTVLAWANSIGDFVADVAIARKGRANMATTACFAGPLFNMLVGLGVGFLLILPKVDLPYPVGVTGTNFISFIFLIASLVSSLLVPMFFRGHLPKLYGSYLVALYVTFAIFGLLNEFGIIAVGDYGTAT
mmetsp:Transcript_2447/g.6576  ORF Transcript_2447/g.6576 Transcript_2447/m.6576 type:complete len:158 (+) Transcript_2447:67-540(+)